MMFMKSYNHVIQKSLSQFHKRSHSHLRCYNKPRRQLSPCLVQFRNFSNGVENAVMLPALTDDPPIIWPSIFKRLNNIIQCNLVIKPHLDNDFNMPDFLAGSKQALSIISNALAREDYESIDGLVTTDAINKVRKKISFLNPEQKQLIAMNLEDVYFTFPYEVGIMFDDKRSHQKFVEIMVVYQSLRGLSKMRAANEEPPLHMGLLPEYQKRLFVCNYRFIREYTKGVESSWTVNLINHFMPVLM